MMMKSSEAFPSKEVLFDSIENSPDRVFPPYTRAIAPKAPIVKAQQQSLDPSSKAANLKAYTQRNIQTGKRREIRRKPELV